MPDMVVATWKAEESVKGGIQDASLLEAVLCWLLNLCSPQVLHGGQSVTCEINQ